MTQQERTAGELYVDQVRQRNASARGTREGRDPAQGFRFYVEIRGVYVAEFLECSGISMEREVKTFEEGGVNDFVHQLPGRVKYGNITLKRGITYSRDLWDWFQEGLYDGRVKRRPVSIVLGNVEGNKAKQWDVRDAYPVKWSGSALSSDASQLAFETVELAHHGIALGMVERDPMGAG
jgi:phage tail-like protein